MEDGRPVAARITWWRWYYQVEGASLGRYVPTIRDRRLLVVAWRACTKQYTTVVNPGLGRKEEGLPP